MPDHKKVYQQQAHIYQRLVAREDYQENLLPAIQEIADFESRDVIDLGSGTGRLACLLAPNSRSIVAMDLYPHMLSEAAARLNNLGLDNWLAAASDHRHVPLQVGSADLVISGWSFCYLVVWAGDDWEASLSAGLGEINRLLREGGTAVIIETLGTGAETPQEPEKLQEYFRYLEGKGFERTWLRTDYQFRDHEEAVELTRFFFGDEMLERIGDQPRPVLPECTGIWWKKKK